MTHGLTIPDPPSPDSDPQYLATIRNPEIYVALGDTSLKPLKSLLRRVLPDAAPRVRGKMAQCLHLLAIGTKWKLAAAESGVSWHQLQSFKAHFPVFKAIHHVANVCRDAVRQMERVEALHERGVEGWLEPVFYKGEEVDTVRKFSDKLLELALKQADSTYSDRKQDINVNIGSISFESHGVDHSKKQRPTLDVTGEITPIAVPKRDLKAEREQKPNE